MEGVYSSSSVLQLPPHLTRWFFTLQLSDIDEDSMAPQIYDPKMKEVTVVSDDNAPLAQKRKSSTSNAADGGKKKKTEGGASKKTTVALEAEKRKITGIPFAKAPPLV